MKFLDINGVQTIWNRIKETFVQFNPTGTSIVCKNGEAFKIEAHPNNGPEQYVYIGGINTPLLVSDDLPNVSSAYAGMKILNPIERSDDLVYSNLYAQIFIGSYYNPETGAGYNAPYLNMDSHGMHVANLSNHLCNIFDNTIDLVQDGADYRINGVSIVPEAIEDAWLESNLT